MQLHAKSWCWATGQYGCWKKVSNTRQLLSIHHPDCDRYSIMAFPCTCCQLPFLLTAMHHPVSCADWAAQLHQNLLVGCRDSSSKQQAGSTNIHVLPAASCRCHPLPPQPLPKVQSHNTSPQAAWPAVQSLGVYDLRCTQAAHCCVHSLCCRCLLH